MQRQCERKTRIFRDLCARMRQAGTARERTPPPPSCPSLFGCQNREVLRQITCEQRPAHLHPPSVLGFRFTWTFTASSKSLLTRPNTMHRALRAVPSKAALAGRSVESGSTEGMGICHSYAPDGRCISLLKILLTNFCIFDCLYCVNRSRATAPARDSPSMKSCSDPRFLLAQSTRIASASMSNYQPNKGCLVSRRRKMHTPFAVRWRNCGCVSMKPWLNPRRRALRRQVRARS